MLFSPAGFTKVGELDLAGLLRRGLIGQRIADRAVLPDGDLQRGGRDRDLRLQRVAVLGDHVAVLVQVERAGARVGQLAGGPPDLEEALALDHHVQRIVGLRERPLREEDLVGRCARAQAYLQAGRDRGLLPAGGARLDHGLVDQVLKLRAARLESAGVRIGQVVRDVVDVHLLGGHAAGGAVKCSNHFNSSSKLWRPLRSPSCSSPLPAIPPSAASRTGASR